MAKVKEVQDCVATVGHQHQRPVGQPSPELKEHLAGHGLEIGRINGAMANLRKQHLWGAVSDEEFQSEYQSLKQ